MKNMNENIEIY